MKPFEAESINCVELEKSREIQPPRKYFHFPVVRFALAETLVALDRTEGVREISIGMCDGELTVNFRVLEEWERETQGDLCVPYKRNKNKEE